VRGQQRVEDRVGNGQLARHGRQADQVGVLDPVQTLAHLEGEAGHARGHLSRLRSDHGEVEVRDPLVLAVQPPGLAQDAELERRHAVVDQHGHVLQHADSVPQSWQEIEVQCQNCH
jgi:hypothetical protein